MTVLSTWTPASRSATASTLRSSPPMNGAETCFEEDDPELLIPAEHNRLAAPCKALSPLP